MRPVAIGASATLASIGVGTKVYGFAKDHTARVGERYWDGQLEGTDQSSPEYYGGSAIYECFGGIGLAAVGAALLAKGSSLRSGLLGGAALVAAGALAGYGVGAFSGFSAGERASREHHGVDIQAQADRLIGAFDHDGDKRLSTKDDAFPEYLHKYQFRVPYDGFPTETKWASIENFVKASDANGDAKVDRQELIDKLESYDANDDGLISAYDADGVTKDGLERLAVQAAIYETDPWGGVIPVPW